MWNTDEPGDSYIEFGFDSTFGNLDSVFGPTLSKSLTKYIEEHKITLTWERKPNDNGYTFNFNLD